MPNHVENDLYVTGTEEQLNELLALIGVTEDPPVFDVARLIPYPDLYKTMDDEYPKDSKDQEEYHRQIEAYITKWNTDRDGYNSGGYEWCLANWGTKWGAYHVYYHWRPKPKYATYRTVVIHYETAWRPLSNAVLGALHARFPEVNMELIYFECGMEMAGGATWVSEEDHWQDDPWDATEPEQEWQTKSYHGHRGG
jgi:hypothetical protein